MKFNNEFQDEMKISSLQTGKLEAQKVVGWLGNNFSNVLVT